MVDVAVAFSVSYVAGLFVGSTKHNIEGRVVQRRKLQFLEEFRPQKRNQCKNLLIPLVFTISMLSRMFVPERPSTTSTKIMVNDQHVN